MLTVMHCRPVATMFFTCVDQANLAVVEQFGKFNRIAQPGTWLGAAVAPSTVHLAIPHTPVDTLN